VKLRWTKSGAGCASTRLWVVRGALCLSISGGSS
jgi:hypothetical protein